VTTVSTRGAAGIELSEAEAGTLFDERLAGDFGGSSPRASAAARLRESGVHHVTVTGEVMLGIDRGLAALSFIRFLRETTSVGVWVSWSGTVDPDLVTESLDWQTALYHLPPPSSDSAWRAGHEAGLCYYRVGPGFVQVTDRRPGAPPRQVVLNGQPQLDLFTGYLVPGPVPAAGDARSAAFSDLVRDRLVLRTGDQAVTLPHRLLCRPVPWNVF
jgi:hypothetical protein